MLVVTKVCGYRKDILNLYIILYWYSFVSLLSIIYLFPAMLLLLVTVICYEIWNRIMFRWLNIQCICDNTLIVFLQIFCRYFITVLPIRFLILIRIRALVFTEKLPRKSQRKSLTLKLEDFSVCLVLRMLVFKKFLKRFTSIDMFLKLLRKRLNLLFVFTFFESRSRSEL